MRAAELRASPRLPGELAAENPLSLQEHPLRNTGGVMRLVADHFWMRRKPSGAAKSPNAGLKGGSHFLEPRFWTT
jgi:hypothetical protein